MPIPPLLALVLREAPGLVKEYGPAAVDWLRHLQRVTGVVDNQVRNLRKRMLVEGYRRRAGIITEPGTES